MKSASKKINENGFVKALGNFFNNGALWVILSFFIPVFIMLLAFKAAKIHPYGDNQMLVVDLWHQYYPFFRVVREKLLTGGSFLYSWSTGLGTNFLSLISYYAASPLNWTSVFFSEDSTRDALTYILTAKIGFCGMFFSMFLRYTFKRNDVSITVFSVMFALCSYMLGYYWNVMWFDTIALFPLVMLGITAICREGKWKLFTLSLALSLISNYYIAFFTCIFAVFAFAVAIVCEGKGIKDFFKKLWIILRSSVIGIALGGFMLLPAYYGLQLTYSANNTFPQVWETYEKWTDIFANTLSFNEPAMKEGLPNFACGVLGLLLLGVFLITPKIRIREKISAVLMLALIAVSCNFNVLNFIWHGFHFTNMIPYRFAFIFSFILITAAYRAMDAMLTNGIKIYQLIAMPVIPAVILYLCRISDRDSFDAAMNGETNYIRSSVIIMAVFFFIFIVMKLIPFKNHKQLLAYTLSIAIGIGVVYESYKNACIGVQTVGSSGYSSYPDRNQEVQTVLSEIRKSDSDKFYRTEMKSTYSLNDSALYGYNGLSQFSSSANVNVTKFTQKMGLYASEAGNRYYYRISPPVTNAFFGIKYIVSKSGAMLNDDYALEKYCQDGQVSASINKFNLPIGFMVNSDVKMAATIESSSPYDYQNQLLSLCTGIQENVFTPQPVALASYDGLKVTKNSYGNYSFTKENPDSSMASVSFTYDSVENSSLYGYITNGGFDNASVSTGGKQIDTNILVEDYPITFPMGNSGTGEQSVIKIAAKEDVQSGNGQVMVYALNHAVWEEMYKNLADEALNITEFSDTKIKGNVTALNEGVMYFSIPYEKGWSVYVDGEKAETYSLMGAMLGVNISAGEHEIELSYIPEGFKTGVTASATGALLFIFIAVIDRRRKNKKSSESENNDTEQTEEFTENHDINENSAVSEHKESTETEQNEETKDSDNEKS